MKLFSTAFRRAVLPVLLPFSFAFQAHSQTLDTVPPVVQCVNGISINVGSNQFTLWATDFLVSASDNETNQQDLQFAIRKEGEGSGFPVSPDTGMPQTSITYRCEDSGTQLAELWVKDQAGNSSYCTSAVIVNALPECNDSTIQNQCMLILTENGDGVEAVNFIFEGASNGTPNVNGVDTTNQDGYVCLYLPLVTNNYTFTPEKNVFPLNGVNAWDLHLIGRHILGLEPLNSAYKLIAADANKSGSITTFDVVEFRNLILGRYLEMPNNTSWRFVSYGQKFSSPGNPFADIIQETMSITGAVQSWPDTSFIGIKVGDVDLTAVANSTMSAPLPVDTVALLFEDRTVQVGDVFSVDFSVSEFLPAYQLTLAHPGLMVVSTPNEVESFGVFSEKTTTVQLSPVNTDFSLTFQANSAGLLRDMLDVNDDITQAIGFRANSEMVVFEGEALNPVAVQSLPSAHFALAPNSPNPWNDHTVMRFNLSESAHTRIEFTDETGRQLHAIEGDYSAGNHEIRIDRTDLPGVGVVFVRLETDRFTAVQKMMVLNR